MKHIIRLVICLAMLGGSAGRAEAFHAWSNYHWARSQNPVTLRVIDSLTPEWNEVGLAVKSDWSKSSKVDGVLVGQDDSLGTRQGCSTVAGHVRVCNAQFGTNGWVGYTEIWLDGANHIEFARSRMNDSYFLTQRYNNTVTRRHVLCHEVGHFLGLSHQHGEAGPSCIDDVNGLFDPAYVSPNAHDYEELDAIYSHLDGPASLTMSAQSHGRNDPNKRVEKDGKYTKITWITPAKKDK